MKKQLVAVKVRLLLAQHAVGVERAHANIFVREFAVKTAPNTPVWWLW